MGNLSKNFSRHEFACKCGCGRNLIDAELIKVMQEVRDKFGAIIITSGNRCPAHNKKIKGSTKSTHMSHIACDFKSASDVSPKEIYDFLDEKYPDMYGLGLYDSWVHIDVREDKARWTGKKV